MRYLAILLALCLQSCASLWWANPQALVDYSDWARERNEHGIWRQCVADMREKAEQADLSMLYAEVITGTSRNRCEVNLTEKDYPVTFAIPGIDYGWSDETQSGGTVVVYPLGNHDLLEHEMTHIVTTRAKLSTACLTEIVAIQATELSQRNHK